MKLPKITFFSILFFIFSTAVYSQTDFLIVNDNPNPASAQMMRRSLLDLGRMVDLVEFSSHDPAIYDGYNVVIWSAGNNDANIFNDATKREALVQRAISEKKVWVEGGEVGFYYSSSADSAFRKKVLHIQEWYNDGVTSSLQFIVPSHPIFTIVTGLASPIVFSGSDPKDRDVMRTLPNDEGRVRLGNWSGLGNDTSLMGINEWSTSPNQVTTHTLFTSFNVTAIADSEVAKSFIRNVGVYMLIPDNDPTLILYSPMSREIWQENTPQIIRWAKNRVSYVRLEYKLVGEPEWTLIADSVPAFRLDENGDRHYEFNENGEIVGLFEWTVPEIATLDTGAHVRVSSIDDPNLNAVNPLPFYISEYPAPHWSLRPSATSAQGRLMSTYIQVGDTGFVYAMGGGENSGSNLNQRYNTRTGQWVRKDTLRLKSSTGGAVTVKNKIYVIGGYNNVSQTLDRVQIYNPVTDTWTLGTPMPPPVKADFGIGVYRDSLIYIFGGDSGINSGGRPIRNVRVYNPTTNNWYEATPLRSPIAKCAAGIFRDGIILAGGSDRERQLVSDTVFRGIINPSNPLEIQWDTVGRYPGARIARLSAATVNLGIVFTGGDSNFSSTYKNKAYLCVLDTFSYRIKEWFPLPNMTYRRSNMGPSLATNGYDSVWAIGGYINGVQLPYNERLFIQEIPDGISGFERQIPSAFLLHQNYPNPFNPRTSITFTLKNAGLVTMKIYNIVGQEVSTLINERRDIGNYTETLDATKFSSGVYFYRITVRAENGTVSSETKKMVLLK